jgi:hypothetical protein
LWVFLGIALLVDGIYSFILGISQIDQRVTKKIGVGTGALPKVSPIALPLYTNIDLALANMMIRINLLTSNLQ